MLKPSNARTLRDDYVTLLSLATPDMKRTNASTLLLLARGVNALGGLGVVSRVPSLALVCGQKPPAILGVRSRQSASRSPGADVGGRTTSKRRLYCCSSFEEPETQAPSQREYSRRPPQADQSCAPTGSASPLKQTLAKIALAAILTPAVFVGGMALPPAGVAGVGIGAVAPAFAELEPLPLKSYSEEFSSGLAPVNSVRGLWRTRETRNDGSTLPTESGKLGNKGICRGRLSFKGFVGAGKGTVEYQGCGDREGKGRWLTKPKNVVNGRITLSARWKINFSDGTSLLYRGDVVQDSEGTALTVDTSGAAAKGGGAFERPDAHIRGEVLKPITNMQGSLSEKKIGEFEADLIELPSDQDKM